MTKTHKPHRTDAPARTAYPMPQPTDAPIGNEYRPHTHVAGGRLETTASMVRIRSVRSGAGKTTLLTCPPIGDRAGDEAPKSVKRSVTIDQAIDDQAHALVGKRGFSGLVNDALARYLQHVRIATYLAEREAELGPIPEEDLEHVRRAFANADRKP